MTARLIRRCSLAAALTLATSALAQTTVPSTVPSETSGVDKLRARVLESYRGGDVNALMPYLDADVVVVFPDGEILRGREALKDYVARKTRGPDAIVERYTTAPEIQHRDLRGDAVLSYGLMNDHYVLKDSRGEFDLGSRFTVTAARVPGGPADTDGWVVRSFHQSADVFANPVLTTTATKALTYGGAGGLAIGLVVGAVGGRWLAARRRPRASV